MTDLFVYTADADAEAVMNRILVRHQSLGIRPISFEVDRHPMRDSGMLKEGPELLNLRLSKSEYSRLLMLWDHEGSNWRGAPAAAVTDIQNRLDRCSWAERSAGIVLVPELEEWLWHNKASIAKLLKVSTAELDRALEKLCRMPLFYRQPKECFETMFARIYRRKPLPGDFEQIAATASLAQWQSSDSFSHLVKVLRLWFPVRT